MHETKSLKDLACNVLNKNRSNAKSQQRITLTLQHQNQNVTGKLEVRTDKTDKPHDRGHLSVMSVPPEGALDKNLGNISEVRPDKPDRFNSNANMSVLSGLSGPSQGDFDKSALLDDHEERLAIAEYDGHQSPAQAQRIAYLDAFMAVLNALPHDEEAGGYYDEDWLTRRIKATQSWLVAQGLHQPK